MWVFYPFLVIKSRIFWLKFLLLLNCLWGRPIEIFSLSMMTLTLSETFCSRGCVLQLVFRRLLELQIDPSRQKQPPLLAESNLLGSNEMNSHPSCFSPLHMLLSHQSLYQDLYSCRQKLGLTTRWQMICQTRALVISVTTINWRTTSRP